MMVNHHDQHHEDVRHNVVDVFEYLSCLAFIYEFLLSSLVNHTVLINTIKECVQYLFLFAMCTQY